MNREPSDWIPAVIVTHERLLWFHTHDAGQVTKFAGRTIKVRRVHDVDPYLIEQAREKLGCIAQRVEVHPDDAWELWPDLASRSRVTLCDCDLLMD